MLSRDMDQWLARDTDLAEGCHVRLFLCRQGQASPADVLWAPPSEEDGCTGLRASASTRCSKPTGTAWCLHPTVWLQQITHRCSDSHLALSFLQHHFFFFLQTGAEHALPVPAAQSGCCPRRAAQHPPL